MERKSQSWQKQKISDKNLLKAYKLSDRIDSQNYFKVRFSTGNVKRDSKKSANNKINVPIVNEKSQQEDAPLN